MAIIVTSAGSHSLQVRNTSASPQSNYLCNLATINVSGDPFYGIVNIQNSNGQVMQAIPIASLQTVAASTPTNWTIGDATAAIASLIIA